MLRKMPFVVFFLFFIWLDVLFIHVWRINAWNLGAKSPFLPTFAFAPTL